MKRLLRAIDLPSTHFDRPIGADSLSETEQQVLAAADILIDAFARHDRDAYFAAFAPDATFLFYHVTESLPSRVAYEALWHRLEQEQQFAVLGCESSDRSVQLVGECAIFTHAVRTTVSTRAGRATLDERESIVFARTGGGWLAVHEHLSPLPAHAESDQTLEESAA